MENTPIKQMRVMTKKAGKSTNGEKNNTVTLRGEKHRLAKKGSEGL